MDPEPTTLGRKRVKRVASADLEDIVPHRTFGWVWTEPDKSTEDLDFEFVVETHGIPRNVLLGYYKGELEGAEAIKALPMAFLLILFFALMANFHEGYSVCQSVEQAVRFDVENNANFAFGGYKGHKTYKDVNSYADFWSWMNLGFSVIYLPRVAVVSEGSTLPVLPITLGDASAYLGQNRKIGPVRFSQTVKASPHCINAVLADANDLRCRSDSSLYFRMEPTLGDVQQMSFNPDDNYTVWLDYLMHVDGTEISDQLRELEQKLWINQYTDTVSVTFLVYNSHADVLTSTSVRFMFSTSGHIWKTILHRSIRMHVYTNWRVYLIDILFYGQITWMLLTELKEVIFGLVKSRCRALSFLREYLGFWNVVDWLAIAVAYAILGIWIKRASLKSELSKLLMEYPEQLELCRYDDNIPCGPINRKIFDLTDELGWILRSSNYVLGCYPVCIMLRLFKAFSMQPRLAIVADTLKGAFVDLAHFGVVFLAVVLTYAITGMLLFGNDIARFSSFDRSMLSLLEGLLGNFDIAEFVLFDRGLVTFVYFMSFQVLCVLLLLNMLIAIMMDVYAATKLRVICGESVWHETYDVVRRFIGFYTTGYIPLKTVVDAYTKAVGEDNIESAVCVKPDELASLVPGMKRSQALEEMIDAVREWAAENSRPVLVSELFGLVNASIIKAEEERKKAEKYMTQEEAHKRLRSVSAIATLLGAARTGLNGPRNFEIVKIVEVAERICLEELRICLGARDACDVQET